MAFDTAKYLRVAQPNDAWGTIVIDEARSSGGGRNGVEVTAKRRRHCWPYMVVLASEEENRVMDVEVQAQMRKLT